MSAQPTESQPSFAAVPERTLTLAPPLVDEVYLGLQEYLGEERKLVEYDSQLRKDYIGPASRKVQIGGALIVSVTVEQSAGGNPLVEILEINDSNRPLDESLIKRLGAIAEAN